jgi:DNA helicase-2/ATP-dependent DNA helicase PcrA
MNTLILTRAHYRRRYGNDAPELSIPSRFLEEVPNQLIENLVSRSPAWSTPAYGGGRGARYRAGRNRANAGSDFDGEHYNYEDESQEAYNPAGNRASVAGTRGAASKPFVASWMTAKAPVSNTASSAKAQSDEAPEAQRRKPDSIDNIARFFGGKPIAGKQAPFARPAIDIPEPHGATGLKKGQHVRHSKYGEGTVLMREGDGENAKLTVMFNRHGLKKLMEKFANLEKI